jgi:hypothetical protein
VSTTRPSLTMGCCATTVMCCTCTSELTEAACTFLACSSDLEVEVSELVGSNRFAWEQEQSFGQLVTANGPERAMACLLMQVDRFEIGCAETRKKFSMMAPPEVSKRTAGVGDWQHDPC